MSTQIIDTLRAAIRTITFPEDDWEEIAKAQIEAAIDQLSAQAPDATSAAEAIRRLTSRIAKGIEMAPTYSYVAGDVDKDLEVLVAINSRADALEAARRDAEARAKRLNDALLIVAAIADDRGKRLSPYSPDTLSEDAQSEMGLHPGDVRRMAGPQRGGAK